MLEAKRRTHEFKYSRGRLVTQSDMEAKEMADCRMRYRSYDNSQVLNGTQYAVKLAQLGYYFVGDLNSPGKIRCSVVAHLICSSPKIRPLSHRTSIND